MRNLTPNQPAKLTSKLRARLRLARKKIAAELPDLANRDRMRKEARDENTLSGELRRAVHASRLPLKSISQKSGISEIALDEFLTGERTLRSDALDRLASLLHAELVVRS